MVTWNDKDSDPKADILRMKKIMEEDTGIYKCGACGETLPKHTKNCPVKIQQERMEKLYAEGKINPFVYEE